MNFPADLKYTTDHEWVRQEAGVITIGITDFAQGELGDIIFVEFPAVGEHLETGAPFGTIEAVKTVADLFVPISGKVAAINDGLEDHPERVNDDPYDSGWLIRITPDNVDQISELMDAKTYQASL